MKPEPFGDEIDTALRLAGCALLGMIVGFSIGLTLFLALSV